MGNWIIVIAGTGAHHNKDYEGDADKIFKKTVQKLKEAGQQIEHASITYGGRDIDGFIRTSKEIFRGCEE